MGTPYETIYNRCLSRIDDPTLVMFPEEDLEDLETPDDIELPDIIPSA